MKKPYEQYQNPYPIETVVLDFRNDIKWEATHSLFNTTREYTESFNIYDERATFEWQQLENDGDPIILESHRKKSCDTDRNVPIEYERIVPRNREDLLPESIRRFTVKKQVLRWNQSPGYLRRGRRPWRLSSAPSEWIYSKYIGRSSSLDWSLYCRKYYRCRNLCPQIRYAGWHWDSRPGFSKIE